MRVMMTTCGRNGTNLYLVADRQVRVEAVSNARQHFYAHSHQRSFRCGGWLGTRTGPLNGFHDDIKCLSSVFRNALIRSVPRFLPSRILNTPMAKENIVIVGGGGAGIGLARALSAKLDASQYNLILISARSKYVHLLAALRFLVSDEGKLEEKAIIPLDTVFVNGNGTLKVGKVVAVDKASGVAMGGDVVLESGEKVPFRYLVLATGSLWEGPLSLPDGNDALLSWIQEWRTKFKNANDIVIVGAGAVGLGSSASLVSLCDHSPVPIELAGELRDVYPVSHPSSHVL